MKLHHLLAGLVLAASTAATWGQTAIYRCGNEYSRTPCSSGREVDTRDSKVDAARHAEAKRVAADERKLANTMANDRRAAEAAVKPAMAGSLGSTRVAALDPKAKAAKSKKGKGRGKPGEDTGGDFVATAPKLKAKA